MAINYSYGLNPNMGNFVSSYLRGTGMQANAFAEEEKAKAKASAQVSNAFSGMISQLAMSYGKAKKAEQTEALSNFKDDFKAESARLTDQRNRFQVGTDEYNYYNDQIFELGKEYKADVANYKKSGTFNKDASLLGFDSSDPTFTGLSDEAQGQMMKNSRAIMNLQRQKDKIDKEEESAKKSLSEDRREIGNYRDFASYDTERSDVKRNMINALTKRAGYRGSSGQVTQDDPMYKGLKDKVDDKFAPFKELQTRRENINKSFENQRSDIDQQINQLKALNEGILKEGDKTLEGYEFDPRTGKELNKQSLKVNEQRRYQEEKQKGVLRGQALGMMLSAGVDVSDMDTTGTPYSMMNEEQLQAVQNNAMEPELRQIGGDALKFGTTLSADNDKHVSVAKEFGMSIPEFNKHVKVAYESQTMNRIRSAGGNYEALKSIKEEINNKGADFLKGTSLSGNMIDRAIEDSKIAHQKTMYSNMNQVLSLGDSGTATRWLEVNKDRIAQYEKDGVLPKGFADASKSLVDTKIKNDGITSNLKDQQRRLNLLQDYLRQGTTSETGMTPQLRSQINKLSLSLGFDGEKLLQDVNEQNKLDRQSQQLSQEVKLLDFSEKMRKALYEQEYGTGPTITGASVTEDGRVGFQYRKTNDGKIDVKDAMKKFINRYFSETGMTLTAENPAYKEHEKFLKEYNRLLGAEESLRRGVFQLTPQR